MNQKDRQKMCGHCDGRVPFDANVCPYCTGELTSKPVYAEEPAHPFETIRPLYPPLYSEKKAPPSTSKPPQGFMAQKKINNTSLGAPTLPAAAIEDQNSAAEKNSFWPILFLSLGANLLLLGILQLLFSDQGFLRLEWNSKHWFVYCLIGAPLLLFGFKKAKQCF